MELFNFLFCLALINVVTCGPRVSCYHCRYLQFPNECKYIQQCEEGESCYIERLETSQNISGWVQGCTKLCFAPFEAPLSHLLVGRDLYSREMMSRSSFDVIGFSKCRQCCNTDFCNLEGCGAPELEANSTRLHCYNCKKQVFGAACDTVTLCESDEFCSYNRERIVIRSNHVYNVFSSSCRSKQDCDHSSLEKNVSECSVTCCDRNYCNTRCNLTLNLQTEIEKFCATLNNYTYFTSTDSCVKISTTRQNFTDASLACAQDMADLVILQTQKKYQLIKELLKVFTEWDVWIGGEKAPGEGFFQWKNGGPVNVHSSNWLRVPPLHQPDNIFTLSERCVYMSYQNMYQWYDTDCDRTMGYICEIKAATVNETRSICYSHLTDRFLFDQTSGVCIRVEKSNKLTWDESLSTCKGFNNGSLITINSTNVTDFVLLLIFNQLQNDTNYWIGGRSSDQHSADFAWTDGTRFSQMQKFPPLWGLADVNEHYCIILDHTHAFNWSYRHCDEHYHYVCEVTKESLLQHQTTLTQPPNTPTQTRQTKTSTYQPPETKLTTTSTHQPSNTSTQTKQTLTSTQQSPNTSTPTTISTYPTSILHTLTKEISTTNKMTTTTLITPMQNANISTSSTSISSTSLSSLTGSTNNIVSTSLTTPKLVATSLSTPLTDSTLASTKPSASAQTTTIQSTSHLETITHPQTSKPTSSVSSPTPIIVSSTAKPPYTIPPVSKICHVCSGPEVLCEILHESRTCSPPDNYCMNTVYNHVDGTRMVKRQCASFDTCYREWWMGSSDDDKCRTFDQDFYMTLEFQCSFCCVEDNCNARLNPPTNTLYKDL